MTELPYSASVTAIPRSPLNTLIAYLNIQTEVIIHFHDRDEIWWFLCGIRKRHSARRVHCALSS
jgi:hypothetical protein